MKYKIILFCLVLAGCAYVSCKHEPMHQIVPVQQDNFPSDVGAILLTKCATAGCHNAASYQVSGGGLLLDSWEHLFNGGNTGAAIVPFSLESSPLLYFTNSFADLGPVPDENMKMPLNNPPLTREEYLTLRNWVLNGAPDKNGNIPFASNSGTRQKIYLAHQGCDYITVIDAEKNVVMRCVPTGKEITIESAYSLKIAQDGFAYISFWASQYILKMNTASDSLADEINIGSANSTMLFASPSGSEVLLSNLFTNSLLRINTDTKLTTATYGNGTLANPHGIAANSSFDTFFVTEQFGNFVHKITPAGQLKKVSLDGNTPTTANSLNPYNIVMAPDQSRYFVTCAGTQEVRVMDAHTDTLIKIIPVGANPQELALSHTKPYLFVACEDDPAAIPTFRGSIYIINYNTYEIVEKVTDRFNMPHAMTVDDQHQKLFVFSRNIDPNGPVPHHNSATCGGRNGYYSVYDFNTLKPVNNKRYEVTIDPFSADARFK